MKHKVRTLSNCCELISGQHVLEPLVNDSYVGKPYLTGPSDFLGFEPQATRWTEHGTAHCAMGDILITVKGSGCGTMARAGEAYAISRQLMAIRPKAVDVSYVWVCIEAHAHVLSRFASGIIPGLGREHLLSLPIPALGEECERRIGHLSDLELQTLQRIESLLAAKREQKRGLMQQLLTGKLRFPGFTEPWKTVRLGELGNLNRGVTYSGDRDVRNADSIDTVRLLRATNIQGGKLNLDDVTIIDFRRGNLAALLKPGDFVICIANGSKRLVGKNALIGNELSNRPHVVGAFCARFQPADGVAPTFMAAVMESPSYQKWIGILLAGTSINNLKPSDIALIPFHLPTTSAEQRKIGAIWNVLETEIELLEQQRAAFAAQRRGLMEKLLSGEIDIQNPKETAA